MNIFERANSFIRNAEGSAVNLASSIAPWGAPLIPAVNTWQHMVYTLGYPEIVAWVSAIVVELLGLSAISTSLDFWAHNRRYKGETRKAPLWIPIMAFVYYLLVVMSVNVVLEIYPNVQAARVLAIALLITLQVPAASILAVRRLHADLIKEIHDTYKGRKKRKKKEQPKPIVIEKSMPVKIMVMDWLTTNELTPFDVGRGGRVPIATMATELGINKSSARGAIHSLRNGG